MHTSSLWRTRRGRRRPRTVIERPALASAVVARVLFAAVLLQATSDRALSSFCAAQPDSPGPAEAAVGEARTPDPASAPEPPSFPDPDCVFSPFWSRLQKHVIENTQSYYEIEQHDMIEHSPLLDPATARLALTQTGCPLGKLIACFAAKKIPVLECLQIVHVTYDEVMASRWPVFAFLDREQALYLKGVRLLERPHTFVHRDINTGQQQATAEQSNSKSHTLPEDCAESAHPSLEWNNYRRHVYQAVTEAVLQLGGQQLAPLPDPVPEQPEPPPGGGGGESHPQSTDPPPAPVGNPGSVRSLDEAMDFGSGIVWKSASNTLLDGHPVSYWTNLCVFGVAAATSLRAFGMLLNENDVFRGVERIWQQQAKFFHFDLVAVLLQTRWRWFGLQHALSLLKRVRLDLPREILEGAVSSAAPVVKSAERRGAPARGGAPLLPLLPTDQSEEEAIGRSLPRLRKRLQHEIAQRARVVFVLMTPDKVARVPDFLERYFRLSRKDGGVAVVYEQPNLAVPCHAGVREALFLLWNNEQRGEESRDALREMITEYLVGLQQEDADVRQGGKAVDQVLEGHFLEGEQEFERGSEDDHRVDDHGDAAERILSSLESFEDFLLSHAHFYQRFCFPRLSVTTPLLSLLGYLRLAMEAQLDAGFLTLHHFFVKPGVFDFFWEADINTVPEFFQPHALKKTALFLRATAPGFAFLDDVLQMLYRYPFSVYLRVLPRILFGAHVPDTVPSISFGEEKNQFRSHLPHVHFLDSENAFATSEAWYGDWQSIVLFEMEPPHLLDFATGKDVLSELYRGEREGLQNDVEFEFRDHVSNAMRRAQKPVSPRRPVIDLYHDLQNRADYNLEGTSGGDSKLFTADGWRVVQGYELKGFAANVHEEFENAERAKHVCRHLGPDLCGGVTCSRGAFGGCTIREGEERVFGDGEEMESGAWTETLREVAGAEVGEEDLAHQVVTLIPPGMRFLRSEKLHHVNFAMNCCAEDQRRSSDSATEIGRLHSSDAQNETHLTDDFKERNHALLHYYRHPALTIHKTPTAKKGYYVWKAFIFLQALENAQDDSIVVWSDAGVSFLKDLRPLVARYLRGSDVAGCRTVMLEGDWSKRDAFLLTDMDFKSIVESNQIASSLIMARKTPLALQLAKQWLIHSEDPRIMTEEASMLGYPEYPNYHNNNDDQTAFSLNFKKFGFLAFSTGLRDEYVLLGRNLAKFIANSNAFARGESVGSSDSAVGGGAGEGEGSEVSSSSQKKRQLTGEEVRAISEKLNKGEIEEVDVQNQDYYIEAAKLRDDEAVRRHRDGSYEI